MSNGDEAVEAARARYKEIEAKLQFNYGKDLPCKTAREMKRYNAQVLLKVVFESLLDEETQT